MASAEAFLDEKPTADEFLKQSSQPTAEEFLQPQIKLDPYQQAYLTTQAQGRPMLNPEREGEGEFTRQIFQQLPEDVRNMARGVGSDLLLMTPHESTFANTKAALYREPLPIDKDLAELAKTDPITATAGHVAQDLMGFAPMAPALAAGGWPLMLVLGGQMLSEAPEQVKELGDELGKLPADQDKDKIARLRAQLLQTTAFTALPTAHGVGRLTKPKPIVTPSVTEPAGSSPTGVPTVTPVEPAVPVMSPPRIFEAKDGAGDIRILWKEPLGKWRVSYSTSYDLAKNEAPKGHDDYDTLQEAERAAKGEYTADQKTYSDFQEKPVGVPPNREAIPINQGTAEGLSNQIEKGPSNASTIRENQGQLREGGQTAEGSQTPSGNDLERQTPGRSESVEPGGKVPPNVQGQGAAEVAGLEKPVEAAFRDPNTGKVYTGGAHVRVQFPENVDPESLEMGFVTNKGRFVDYDTGLKLGQTAYDAEQAKPAMPPAPGEIVSMGAANLNSPEFGPNEGRDITGVAQRVREQVAASGQEALPPRGEGISTPDSVERGEGLLTVDPTAADVAMEAFEKDPSKAVSADAMALARAKLRRLAFAARRIEEKFGTDSPQYRAAWQARSDWAARIKPMQTEWHKSGMAQQGEQDIDTGTFTGLREAYTDATGKDFTPGQEKTAKDVSGRVKKAEEASASANTKLKDELSKQSGDMTDAEKRAFDAANKTVRENAARLAEAENKSRVATTVQERATAKIQEDAARKALDAANKTVKDAAARAAKAEVNARVNPEKQVWEKVKEYLDQGMDSFDDMRNKVATDLGMSVRKVTEILTSSKRAKFLANDAWRKQEALRRFQSQAKRWLQSTQTPGYQQALAAIPRTLFALKVGFHGTVALGTHAPMLAFQPAFWKQYIQNFGRMYRMVGSTAYYERQVQDLLRRPNYITARRAGLQNDPSSYEEYAVPGITGAVRRGVDAVDPRIVEYFNKLTGSGNRGYAVLKVLRQDLFDHHWNNLPQTAKTPDMAAAIADGVNHVTGVIKAASPKGANIALFAPRLLASRVGWLAGDPIRAADTFLRWNKSSPAEKRFAIQQVKEKAWVAGTLLSLLAVNQGMLKAIGSDQEVNFDDPFRSDFLKFKAFGQNISYGNAMLTMARLPIRLYRIRESDGGKLKNLIYPDEDSYNMLGEYARSQASPFASLAMSLWLKSDWQNRPLPSSERPMPKRLRARGIEPYTWPEFWTEQVLPIPAEEAIHEVWAHGLGMDDNQMKAADKAMATLSVIGKVAAMAGTGGRISPDYDVSP